MTTSTEDAVVPGVSRQTVTVTGIGTAEAIPDVVIATFGTETRAGTVSESLDSAMRSMAEVIARLRAGGVGDLDLSSGSASIWSMADEQGRVMTYTATQRLTAKLRNVATAGALVGEAVAAGGDSVRLHGMAFSVTDTRRVDEWARVQAWLDARAKAGQLATLARRTLGPVVRIRETAPERPATPLQAMSASAPVAVPLEPGTETVIVAIEVEWAFLS